MFILSFRSGGYLLLGGYLPCFDLLPVTVNTYASLLLVSVHVI